MKSDPKLHHKCHQNAPANVFQKYIKSAPQVHQKCSKNARNVYQKYTKSVPQLSLKCTKYVPKAHQIPKTAPKLSSKCTSKRVQPKLVVLKTTKIGRFQKPPKLVVLNNDQNWSFRKTTKIGAPASVFQKCTKNKSKVHQKFQKYTHARTLKQLKG
jgi:hypothetical protein